MLGDLSAKRERDGVINITCGVKKNEAGKKEYRRVSYRNLNMKTQSNKILLVSKVLHVKGSCYNHHYQLASFIFTSAKSLFESTTCTSPLYFCPFMSST